MIKLIFQSNVFEVKKKYFDWENFIDISGHIRKIFPGFLIIIDNVFSYF